MPLPPLPDVPPKAVAARRVRNIIVMVALVAFCVMMGYCSAHPDWPFTSSGGLGGVLYDLAKHL